MLLSGRTSENPCIVSWETVAVVLLPVTPFPSPPSLAAGSAKLALALSQHEAKDVLAPSSQPRSRTISVPKIAPSPPPHKIQIHAVGRYLHYSDPNPSRQDLGVL